MTVTIRKGFAEADRPRAAQLYWQAFGAKLGKVLGPDRPALPFFERIMNPDFALCAYDGDTLLGLAGFKTKDGALTGGSLGDVLRHYRFGAVWRLPLLSMLERESPAHELCMDGICVSDQARGQGLGTRLLSAIKDEATRRGKIQARLDVININPRAKSLYQRQGFVIQSTEHLGPLRHVFGFDSADRMVWTVPHSTNQWVLSR